MERSDVKYAEKRQEIERVIHWSKESLIDCLNKANIYCEFIFKILFQ